MNQEFSIRSLDEYTLALVNQFGFGYSGDAHSFVLRVPEKLGTGYMKMTQVSDDIGIGIIDVCLREPLVNYYEEYEQTCEVTYCLSGHISYAETDAPSAVLGKNELGIFAIPSTRGMMMMPSGERIHAVGVVSGKPFHSQLPHAGACERFDTQEVCDMLTRLVKPVKASAKTHNHFTQILDNQIGGPLRNTYLDSLGKVLLSDLWHDKVVTPLSGKEHGGITGFEHTALLNAREILTAQYLDPPSTGELARLVALNEHRLRTGFKQLFGKSLYDYARGLRLEDARHLLEDASLSVGQVASLVGYVNASHFAQAFRKEYGVNPSDLRVGA